MTIFTIDEQNNITAFASQEEATAASTTPFDSFGSEQQLAELVAGWPAARRVALWNSLPGVTPVKSFRSPKAAAARVWKRIQGLGDAAQPEPEAAPAKPKGGKKAAGRAQSAKGAPVKGKSAKKATPAKTAPKGKKTPKAQEAAGPREGSKTAQVVAMLQRAKGASISEIMDKMDWQRHTTKCRPVSDRQSIDLRRPLEQLRDLPPGSKGQKPKAFGFQLEKDQLFLSD